MTTKGISPTQRTLAALRDRGIICDIVERYNAYAGPFGRHNDFLGFADIIGCVPGGGILAVQSCGQSFSEHLKKLREEAGDNCLAWLQSGGHIELWSWRKVKLKRGGKAMRWSPRVLVVTEAVLGSPEVYEPGGE